MYDIAITIDPDLANAYYNKGKWKYSYSYFLILIESILISEIKFLKIFRLLL